MPSDDPKWVDPDTVIQINERLVAATNEPFTVLDRGKLEGALGRPQASYYYEENENILNLSVNMMVSVADAHAFLQGNKRTGFTSGVVFLNWNSYDLHSSLDTPEFGRLMTMVINGNAEAHEMEAWLEPYVIEFEPND